MVAEFTIELDSAATDVTVTNIETALYDAAVAGEIANYTVDTCSVVLPISKYLYHDYSNPI